MKKTQIRIRIRRKKKKKKRRRKKKNPLIFGGVGRLKEKNLSFAVMM
jgi:hypothetical protein